MRGVLAALIVVSIVLIIFLVITAVRVVRRQQRERKALRLRCDVLRAIAQDVEDEVVLQEDAGYSDVVAFRHILNNYPEALS